MVTKTNADAKLIRIAESALLAVCTEHKIQFSATKQQQQQSCWCIIFNHRVAHDVSVTVCYLIILFRFRFTVNFHKSETMCDARCDEIIIKCEQ